MHPSRPERAWDFAFRVSWFGVWEGDGAHFKVCSCMSQTLRHFCAQDLAEAPLAQGHSSWRFGPSLEDPKPKP